MYINCKRVTVNVLFYKVKENEKRTLISFSEHFFLIEFTMFNIQTHINN